MHLLLLGDVSSTVVLHVHPLHVREKSVGKRNMRSEIIVNAVHNQVMDELAITKTLWNYTFIARAVPLIFISNKRSHSAVVDSISLEVQCI